MWLIPSRRRIAKLREFCNSACMAKTTTPALIIVDKKDYADNAAEYAQLEMHHFPNSDWKFFVSEAEGMGPKVREVWPQIKDRAWVGILNDDHYIITPEWDVRLIAQLNGKNFITCNDRWNAPKRAAGATLFSMPLMEVWGFPMFPKQIDHLGIDDVFEQIGRATGCWQVDMAVVVEHRHVYQKMQAVINDRAQKEAADFNINTALKDVYADPEIVDETHALIYGRHNWQDSPEAKDCYVRCKDFFENDFRNVVMRTKEFMDSDNVAKTLPLSN